MTKLVSGTAHPEFRNVIIETCNGEKIGGHLGTEETQCLSSADNTPAPCRTSSVVLPSALWRAFYYLHFAGEKTEDLVGSPHTPPEM